MNAADLKFCDWDTGANRRKRPDVRRVKWDNGKIVVLCAECRASVPGRWVELAADPVAGKRLDGEGVRA